MAYSDPELEQVERDALERYWRAVELADGARAAWEQADRPLTPGQVLQDFSRALGEVGRSDAVVAWLGHCAKPLPCKGSAQRAQ